MEVFLLYLGIVGGVCKIILPSLLWGAAVALLIVVTIKVARSKRW